MNFKSSRKALYWAFSVLLFLVACQNEETVQFVNFDYYILEAENFSDSLRWSSKDYYTGISAMAGNATPDSNFVSYDLNIPSAGEYRIGVMAANRSYPVENGKLLLNVNDRRVGELQVKNSRALIWTDFVPLQITDTGKVTLKISAENQSGAKVYLDQIVLTNDPDFQPKGYEFETDTVKTVLPPAWAFGVLYGGYTNQEETIDRVNRLLGDGYPIDGYWIDSWFWNYYNQGKGPEGYLDFEGDPQSYPDPSVMWDLMSRNNIKSGIWVWDAIQEVGNEEVYAEFRDKGLYAGEPFLNTNGWHNKAKNTMMGDIDFENPEAVELWRTKMKPFFDQGLDFVKLDKSSKVSYMKAVFEATQELGLETKGRGFIMSHLHTTHDPLMKLYPTKWSGDAKIAWEQPDAPNMGNYSMGALKENIMMVADPNRSTYEVPFLTSDLGGYDYFGSTEQSDSLYMRWTQFAMFNPITTAFSTADSPNSNMPFNFSEQSQQVFKYYARLKHSLFPYIYTYAHLTRETGEKMIRGDGKNLLQYHFGKELLVAPVLKNAKKGIYFPAGNWVDFYTDELISGGKTIDVNSSIERIPLYVRSGSIVPMRTPTQQIETATSERLTLHIYPGEKQGNFVLYEDDGSSNEYLKGAVAKTTISTSVLSSIGITLEIAPVQGRYEGMTTQRDYEVVVHNWKDVRVSGAENVSFDAASARLTFQLNNVKADTGASIAIPAN
ncbi:MAG: TIM-barrel domain-containing protein [Bacteroidota bacterium]